VTLDRPDLARRLTVVRQPRRLPAVLSVEEITLLLQAAPGPKYKAAFATAYGAGLRVSEVVALKVGDIDSERMLLRVEQGKGRKDRDAMLSPQLLELLRDWWGGRPAPRRIAAAGLAVSGPQPDRAALDPSASTAPSTPPPRPPGSGSECRRIRCGTASPPTCWKQDTDIRVIQVLTPYRSSTHRHRRKCTRLDAALPRERVRCVPGMLISSEVKFLCPT